MHATVLRPLVRLLTYVAGVSSAKALCVCYPWRTLSFLWASVDYHKLKAWDGRSCSTATIGGISTGTSQATLPLDWEFMVYNLQRKGFKVIIANPERCREVQKDIDVARRFV